MTRRIVPLAILVVLVVVVIWWLRRDGTKRDEVKASAGSGALAQGLVGVQRQAFPADREIPTWFVRSDSKPRRIAGKVTRDGKPAPGVTVTLQSTLTHAGFGSPVDVKTGSDGRFDFGEWPGGVYSVSAAAPDTQTAIKHVDLANPTLATDEIELTLRPCAVRVSGTLTDATNAAISDGLVRQQGVIVARTDDNGAYSVCTAFGQVELDYSADGYGAVVLQVTVMGDTEQDVVLVPAASVAGRVVRADNGNPVANAFVAAGPAEWARDRAGSRPAISDSTGAFRIDGLTPGKFRLWAYADGLSAENPVEVLAEVGKLNEATIKLVDRARVAGRVTRSGQAVPNVSVSAVRKSPAARSRTPAWTRGDGSFVLDDVPIGDLVFAIEGYEVTAPTVYKIEAAKLYEGVEIEVAQMARIHGVITRNKVPVEGATVWGPNQPAVTDASGHYEFVGLPPGTYQVGAGSDEAGAFTLGTKVTVKPGEDKQQDFELDLAAEIAGTVVDADGKPVKGVFVRWTHASTQDEGRGVTDAHGHYRCRAMSGGGVYTAKVYPTAESQKPFPPASGTPYPSREVKDGTTRIEGVTIAIDMQQQSISGRVVDSNGTPIADAVVKALATEQTSDVFFTTWQRLPSMTTDTDGAFTLRGLLPGTYALQARSPDGAEQVVYGITGGATGVTIKLTRPGMIEGTLVGFTQSAVIYATPWNAPNKLYAGSVDGNRFTVTGLKTGRYVLNAQNMYEGDAVAVDIRAGEKASVTLTAKGRGAIVGTVLDFATKKPIAGAVCRAVMSVDGQQGLTNWDLATAPKSDEAGRVVIDPAPAGNVTVTCMPRQGQRSQPAVDVVVSAGGRSEITLLSVELTVENPGSPGIGFHWQVTPPRIAMVEPNSPAASAGLLAGDLVTAVDGTAVDGLNGMGVAFLIANRPIGSSASIAYQRGGTKKTVSLTMVPGGS